MEIGIGAFDGFEHGEFAVLLKKLGISRTFIASETPDFDRVMQSFTENGIVCETLHAPFSNINDLWGDDESAANAMLGRLKDSVDKCAKYRIPVTVVHLSSGCPMPEINEKGVKRFESLFEYAKEKGVTVALENQRYLENLSYFMSKYPELGFCWDNGHEYGFTKGIRFMELFGNRLAALHIHDNRCGVNTDDHLLPFDGKIDFERVAKDLADSNYQGTLMLEIGKCVSIDGQEIYKNLSGEEYLQKASEAAKKLVCMIEKYASEKAVRANKNPQWLQWAIELQSLAQTGLAYCKDVYDGERYQRIRDISAEMVSMMSEVPLQKVKDLFCCEGGYQTPKIDTRAAIFKDGKILLVRENDGLWSMPGGWCDVNVSIAENTVKEAKEEAGLDVNATRLVAVLDSAKHNPTLCPYGICKFFMLCEVYGGEFVANSETTESGYFDLDELPPLSVIKNNEQQIRMCFEASRSPQWTTVFD